MVSIRAEMAANVWQVRVTVGQSVTAGQELVILESMKMEIPVTAPRDGVVKSVRVTEGGTVEDGDVLVTLD